MTNAVLHKFSHIKNTPHSYVKNCLSNEFLILNLTPSPEHCLSSKFQMIPLIHSIFEIFSMNFSQSSHFHQLMVLSSHDNMAIRVSWFWSNVMTLPWQDLTFGRCWVALRWSRQMYHLTAPGNNKATKPLNDSAGYFSNHTEFTHLFEEHWLTLFHSTVKYIIQHTFHL